MTRPAHPWPFTVQPMPSAVEAVAIRAKGNHRTAQNDEPEADEVLTRDWPMPVSRHPVIQAGEADARAEMRAHTATTKRSGTGLSDTIRAVCTCGWQGREHHESDSFASSAAAADARAHVAAPSEANRG